MSTVEFPWTFCGIPCRIKVENIVRHRPDGDVEYDAQILDRRGRRAQWLEAKINDRNQHQLDDAIFNHMEQKHEND